MATPMPLGGGNDKQLQPERTIYKPDTDETSPRRNFISECIANLSSGKR